MKTRRELFGLLVAGPIGAAVLGRSAEARWVQVPGAEVEFLVDPRGARKWAEGFWTGRYQAPTFGWEVAVSEEELRRIVEKVEQ